MRRPFYRPAEKLRRDDKGSMAVEFALIAPVLVMLTMAIIEFGLILYTYTAAGVASRDVTRRIATGRLPASNASSTLTPQLPQWVRSSATVTVSQTAPGTPASNVITVNVSFPAGKATPTNFLSSAYGTVTLQTATTMQQES